MTLPMINLQSPEKPSHGNGNTLEVVKIWNTIQGEGPFSGWPAIFIRLAGCNLQCPACDTDYTTGRHTVDVVTIANTIQSIWRFTEDTRFDLEKRLVVITGGEPFRQNLSGLVDQLLRINTQVIQIETNGTIPPGEDFPHCNNILDDSYGKVNIVCSPKTPKINSELERHINCYKYIIDHRYIDPNDGLPTRSLKMELPPARPTLKYPQIYVQPMETPFPEQNKLNIKAAVKSAMKFGYILSMQIHKIIGVE